MRALYVGVLLSILVSAGCGTDNSENNASDSSERAAGDVVEAFLRNMLDPSKDALQAYGLLDAASRVRCEPSEFMRIASIGRSMVAGRKLSIEISKVRIRGERADVQVKTRFGSAPGVPPLERAVVVMEDGMWRYSIVTDPTCDSWAAFFGMNTVPNRVPTSDPKCHPAYPHNCIGAPPPLLTCDDIEVKPVVVSEHPDPHNLDPDGDGIACLTR